MPGRSSARFILGLTLWFSQAGATTAFVDVNVLPMDAAEIMPHQNVIVSGDRIVAIGSTTSTPIPADAERIEGRGDSFILPGLCDMHTHVFERADLALYTANGVTTVLHMGDAPSDMIANANRQIDRGELIGPRLFFSLMVDGSPALGRYFVTSPELARAVVDLAKVNGYDFIKLYNNVTPAEFDAFVDEGRRQGLAVIGHGVRAVGLPEGLFKGQVMVAHAEEFYYTAFHNKPDTALIPEVVAQTRRSGAFVTPALSTLAVISQQWGKPEVVNRYLQDPRAALMSPRMRVFWRNRDYVTRTGGIEPMLDFLRKFTKALQAAGVPLITGTDSPVVPGMFPGYSLHEDLRTLIEAGLTPYEALSAATRIPGEFIAKYVPTAAHFGTVSVGNRADLLLVATNPLSNIDTLKTPLGVMTAGRWRSAALLSAALERQRQQYAQVLR